MAGQAVEGDGEISPQHVLHPVREVDEIHHPKHQRKPGGDQKEKDAELQAVKHLNDQERSVHAFMHRLPRKDVLIPGLSAASAKLSQSNSSVLPSRATTPLGIVSRFVLFMVACSR